MGMSPRLLNQDLLLDRGHWTAQAQVHHLLPLRLIILRCSHHLHLFSIHIPQPDQLLESLFLSTLHQCFPFLHIPQLQISSHPISIHQSFTKQLQVYEHPQKITFPQTLNPNTHRKNTILMKLGGGLCHMQSEDEPGNTQGVLSLEHRIIDTIMTNRFLSPIIPNLLQIKQPHDSKPEWLRKQKNWPRPFRSNVCRCFHQIIFFARIYLFHRTMCSF